MGHAKLITSSLLDQHIGVRHGFAVGEEAPLPHRIQILTQIHSDKVLVVRGPDLLDTSNRADAMVTDVHGVFLGVKTADCVPVLAYDPVGGVIAAIHAGWRGLAKDIISKALATMGEHYGSHADDLLVAVGPAAGSCCYEVGKEFVDLFAADLMVKRKGKLYLDLKAAARHHLLTHGVKSDNCWQSEACTICSGQDFASFRRNGDKAGRQISYIGLV